MMDVSYSSLNQRPLFPLGRVVATPGALEAVPRLSINAALARHQSGDWGKLPVPDLKMNDRAVHLQERILSSYEAAGTKFWIIIEADRSVTTILLPSEY